MAIIDVDYPALAMLLMPGIEATIDKCELDLPNDRLIITVSGKDVPDAARARLIFTQTVDDHHRGARFSAAIERAD
jgi:hypothetical protein